MQSPVDHQVLRANCQNALHVLKFDLVDEELLELLIQEVVATWLLTLV